MRHEIVSKDVFWDKCCDFRAALVSEREVAIGGVIYVTHDLPDADFYIKKVKQVVKDLDMELDALFDGPVNS